MKKRLLSIVLALALCLGLLPAVSTTASAADTGKAIQLVDSGTAANISGGQAGSIYFGTYQQSNLGDTEPTEGTQGVDWMKSDTAIEQGQGPYYKIEPIKWRVLSNADGKLFLLSDQNIDVFEYHKEYESVTWETSTVRSWLNGYAASCNTGGGSGNDYTSDNFLDTAFSAKDQAAIAVTTVVNDDNPDYSTEGGNNTTDKVFLLSIAEISDTSYFADDNSRVATNTAYVAGGGEIDSNSMFSADTADYWWLCSPGKADNCAASVSEGGCVDNGQGVHYIACAVRPAFNLNLNAVLLTSAADNSGHNSTFVVPANYSGNEWKLTLKDGNDFSAGASVTGTTALMYGYSDTTLTINHAALNTLSTDYTNVTAMLTDSNGNILYYGSINETTSATESTATIPAGLATGEYTLSVYGEDWNEANYTDYATGTPYTIKITVHEHSWATDWNSDSTHHWHECQNSNCPVTDNSGKDGYAAHSADGNAGNCVCGYNTAKTVEVYVGGLGLAEGEYLDNNGKLSTTAPSGGYAHYANGVLTLNNYVYSGSGYPNSAVHSEQNLTIRLVGESSLVNTAEDGEGITVRGADLVINSSGSLNVTADYGISAYGNVTLEEGYEYYEGKGLLTIQSGTLNITATKYDPADPDIAAALYADGNIKIGSGTFTINAKGDGIDSRFGDISISGGQLDIVSAEGKGIDGNNGGNVTISGGTIQIEAKNDEGIDIDIEGVFTMSGGTVTIEAGQDGIDCTDTVKISGGQLNITAGETGVEAAGIDITRGTVTIQSNTGSAIMVEGDGTLTLGSNMVIQKPAGGKVETIIHSMTYQTIVDGEGNAAYEVELVYRAPSSGGGYTPPSTPPTESVTVPISGDEETIHVDASVSGSKATVYDVDLDHLDTVIGEDVQTGTVTIDFSGLDSSKPITTVEIPSNVVKQIAEAVSNPNNDAHSFEVILSDGTSIEFDAVALGEKAAQADGLDITISIEHHEDAELTTAQKNAVGDRVAYDINVTSGGKHISDMGGKITVHAPYELKAGEKASGIAVWYVDENGSRERCETSYDPIKKRVNWKTDHLSLYMIDHCPSAAFADLDVDAWYHEALDYVIENGMMAGYGETFGPNDSITRGQIVTILHRLEDAPVVNYLMTYEDVAQEKYYTEAIRWATSEGIVAGYGNGKFGPDDPITRQQLATILWRYSQHKGYDVSVGEDTNILSYEDAFDISEYAIPAMQWACGTGIMGGYGNGYLGPNDGASRAQVAAMLMRYCELPDKA